MNIKIPADCVTVATPNPVNCVMCLQLNSTTVCPLRKPTDDRRNAAEIVAEITAFQVGLFNLSKKQ